MGEVIVITSGKGGVGKTTTTAKNTNFLPPSYFSFKKLTSPL